MRRNKIFIAEPFSKVEYTFPKLNTNKYCVFHDQRTRKCIVHTVKPETCVAGPITFDINAKTGRIEWYVKMGIICRLADVVYCDKKLMKEHLAFARDEILRLVRELDSGELKAILKKPEPETFKIAEESIDSSVLSKLTE